MKKIILITIILMLIPQTFAFGLAPAQKTTFKLQEDYTIRILNNQNETFNAQITVPDQYKNQIVFSTNSLEFTQNTQSKTIQIKTNIQKEQLQIGINKIPITITKHTNDFSQVSSRIVITHDLIIINPSLEPYIDFEIQNTNFNELKKGQITIKLTNQGQKETDVKINIEILNQNKTLQNLTKTENIQGTETKNINFEFEPKQIGTNQINAIIITQNQEITKSKNIQIGTPNIKINKITPNKYSLGEIASFEIELETDWPEKINANINVALTNRSSQISTYQSNFEIKSKQNINTYLNTQNINPGNYQKQITITQNQITKTYNYNLIITQNSIHIIDNEGNVLTRTNQEQKTNYTKIGFIISITIFITLLSFYTYLKKFKN